MMDDSVTQDLSFLGNIYQGCMEIARISTIQYHYNPRTLVYQHDKVKLYHYKSKVKKTHTIPLLVVFATVNRPEILDLFPEHSLVGGLLENGMDVYFLDWGYPDSDDKDISLGDYINEYLHHCVEHIIEASNQSKINLLGICQGGIISLCYSILYQNIKNLVLVSTPIDFHTQDNVIAKMFRQLDVDALTDLIGNVSGLWLTNFFISLRPFELVGKKYLRFIDNIENQEWIERFLRVEKWLYDAPDQTGASFTELIKDFYQQNKLIKGEIHVDGKRVDLKKLTIPVLNVMASEDEIVPVSATKELNKYIGSTDYTAKIFPSGHIGIYISDKVGKSMPMEIAKWLKKRK